MIDNVADLVAETLQQAGVHRVYGVLTTYGVCAFLCSRGPTRPYPTFPLLSDLDLPEVAVLLVVGTRREVQSVGRTRL